jgi:hypothetical protein
MWSATQLSLSCLWIRRDRILSKIHVAGGLSKYPALVRNSFLGFVLGVDSKSILSQK